jgi:hypothetical protein
MLKEARRLRTTPAPPGVITLSVDVLRTVPPFQLGSVVGRWFRRLANLRGCLTNAFRFLKWVAPDEFVGSMESGRCAAMSAALTTSS